MYVPSPNTHPIFRSRAGSVHKGYPVDSSRWGSDYQPMAQDWLIWLVACTLDITVLERS